MVNLMKEHRVLTVVLIAFIVVVMFGCSRGQNSTLDLQPRYNNNLDKVEIDHWLPYPAIPTDARLDSLPVTSRNLSAATDPVVGTSFIDQSGKLNRVNESSPTSYILISNPENPVAFAQYNIKDVVGDRPVTIRVTAKAAKLTTTATDTLPLEYYIAVANYSKWCWEWFGPYTGDANLTINSKTRRDRYLTYKDNFNYIIAAAIKSKTSDPVGVSITKSQITTSASAYPTLPYYQKLELARIGQNLTPRTLASRTTSDLSADQFVNLEWTHRLTSRPADDIASYNVYFKLPSEKEFTLLGVVKAPTKDEIMKFIVPKDCDASVQALILSKLTTSTPLEFTIKSVNPMGTATYGKPMVVSIPAVLPPQNLIATSNLDTGIALKWDKAPDASGYVVYRDTQDTPLISIGDVDNYEDPVADTNIDHIYWLKSINTGKEESGFSLSTSGKKVPPMLPLDAVKDLTASTDQAVGIQLNWTKSPNATGYEIYRDLQTTPIRTVGDVNQYLDDTITDLKDYKYWVKAVAFGWKPSPFSNEAIGKMISGGGVLDPPDPVTASTDRSDGILLKWSKVKSATIYKVYRDDQNNLLVTLGDTDTYTDTTITDFVNHTYWVKALNTTDKSDFSKAATGKKVDLTTGDIYEPDNSMGEAKQITPTDKDQVQNRSIKPLADQDWIWFNGTTGIKYTFYTVGTTDTQIFLYDKDGVQLDTDDDDGSGTNFLLQWTCTATDKFFAKMIRYSNSSTGDYDLHFIVGDNVLFPPEGFAASTTRTDGINLTWTKSVNATNYLIYRDKTDNLIIEVDDVASYLDTSVKDSDEHSYWIKAKNATTESGLSGVAKGKMLIIDSYEPDNSTAEAKQISLTESETTQKRNILPAADQDWVWFDALASTTYNFYTSGTLDTIGELYDSSETLVTSDDQSGIGSNFYISWTCPSSGKYYVKIKLFSTTSTGDYQFVFNSGFGAVQPPEGITASTDNPTGVLIKWSKSKSATGYRVFRDDQKNMIGETGDVDNWLDDKVTDFKSHTYWLKSYNPKFESDFSVAVTGRKFREITADKYEPDDSKDAARLITFSSTMQTEEHSIFPEAEEDWLKFNGTKNEIYSLYSISESNLDTYIHIYDSALTELVKDDDSGPGLCFRIDFVCPADGLYYIKLRGYGTSTTYKGWYDVNYYSGGGTLTKPTNVIASKDNATFIKLDWTKTPTATGYFIYRDTLSSTPIKVGDVSTYNDYISDTVEHTYWVRGFTETNGSPTSDPAIGQKIP